MVPPRRNAGSLPQVVAACLCPSSVAQQCPVDVGVVMDGSKGFSQPFGTHAHGYNAALNSVQLWA
eukprot:gene27836-31843_t